MSSKIEVSRELLVDMTHNQHKKVAAYMPDIANLLAAPTAARPDVLPCDVRVAPATTIRKGCKVETLMQCIELRKGQPPEFTVFKGSAPPELAELQATIARLTAENERLQRVEHQSHEALQVANQNTKQVIVERDALAERLKGGQGEPVLWFKRLVGAEYKSDGRTYDVMFCEIPGYTPLFASQPAPVSVVLPDRRKPVCTGSISDFTSFEEARGWNACLDKAKELNQ